MLSIFPSAWSLCSFGVHIARLQSQSESHVPLESPYASHPSITISIPLSIMKGHGPAHVKQVCEQSLPSLIVFWALTIQAHFAAKLDVWPWPRPMAGLPSCPQATVWTCSI